MNMIPVDPWPAEQHAHMAATPRAQMARNEAAQTARNEVAQIAQERAALESQRSELRAEMADQVQAATQRPITRNLRPQAGVVDVGATGEISNTDLEDEEFDEDRPTPVESAAPAAPRR